MPSSRPGTLSLALVGIAIEIVLFMALSENTQLVIAAALLLAAAAFRARPDIFGMPAWLPLAYALFAVLVAWSALSFRQKVWQ
jgi:hypothetical protein